MKQAKMIKEQMINRGITDKRVLHAISAVDRKLFVPKNLEKFAYEDYPIEIGYDQTISQPFIVAFMTQEAEIKEDSRVLEIGTGTGYQTAIIANLCSEIYSIEFIKPLAEKTAGLLERLGYNNVHIKVGNGYHGWGEKAPFDVIMVTAAPEEIPLELVKQLNEGGRMIVPVGDYEQTLLKLTRTKEGIMKEELLPVRFVPMVEDV